MGEPIINIINLGPLQEARSTNPNITSEQIIRSRELRILSVCEQSKLFGFHVRFWEGVIDPRGGWAGIIISFKKIVEWAKKTKLPYIIIGEDDLIFSAPGAWEYYLENMPKEFDIYSGGIYSGQITDGRIMNGWSGNTLVAFKDSFYDRFLEIAEEALNNNDHLDRRMGRYAYQQNYRVCEKFVVYQLQGYSDNHRKETKHDAYIEGMNLFGR